MNKFDFVRLGHITSYTLAKWFDEKIKPLPVNKHTYSEVFQFSEENREVDFNEADILILCEVLALFTNMPLEEKIQILANKAFTWNRINETQNLHIT
ncbi:unnamed protein product [Pocillopora meandrina]|uniref:Uncharacterized protein n=1 Tax=Pocillopora meandrina TaxID=46732 RepID=A0AAU9WEX2_9CNID|nr:unnamed protein product [Pocillopora meandrina]